MDNIYVTTKIYTMHKLINTIKLNYYKLLISSFTFNKKRIYPLLKIQPNKSNSSYHNIRHQIELINYPTK